MKNYLILSLKSFQLLRNAISFALLVGALTQVSEAREICKKRNGVVYDYDWVGECGGTEKGELLMWTEGTCAEVNADPLEDPGWAQTIYSVPYCMIRRKK